MAKPVELIRARVQAAYPGAVVHSRGQKWIKHQIGNRFILDTSIGPIHKADGVTEIDSDWAATTGAWQYQMTGADFSAFSRDTLGVGTMYRFQKGIDYVEFQPLALNWVNDADSRQQITQPQSVVAQVVNGDTLRFVNGYGTGRHFEYETQTARLQKRITIDSAANLPAVTVTGTPHLEIEFIIGKSAGLTEWVNGQAWDRTTRMLTAQRIEYRSAGGATVCVLDYPRAWDSAGNSVIGQMVLRRQGANRFVTVRIPKSWIDTATFPIVLDPTVGDGAIEVGASADDASEFSGGLMDLTSTPLGNVDGADEWNGFRFTGITITDGSTIDVAYLTVQFTSGSLDEPEVTFFGQDSATPATFSSTNTDISGRTRTTASVDWSNTNAGAGANVNTSSLVSIVQELVDSYSYSSGAMAFVMRSTANTATRDTSIQSYDGSTTACARLHIEYTEPSGTSVSAVLNVGAATLSATAARAVNTSGALAITPAVLAGDVDITRTLSGAMTVPVTVLAASTSVTRSASAALIVPAAALAASTAVTRNVSGALSVAPATLAADLDVVRFVSGALNIPASVVAANLDVVRTVAAALNIPPSVLAATLTSDVKTASGALTVTPATLAATVDVIRSVAAALNIPASTLAAAVTTAAKTVAGALQVAGATLAADVAVQRTASGALIVTPAVLAGDATVLRSASGAVIVPAATLSADVERLVAASGALTAPVTTLAADVDRTVSASGALNLPAVSVVATVSILRLASGALALAVPVLNAVTAGEQLTATAALVLPVPVLDADAMVSRTASGALVLSLPVLAGDVERAVNVQGVLVLEAPTLAAQLAIARLVSGDLELPAAILAAQVFLGAVQSVIGLRASVTQGDTLTATVTAIRPSATVH